MSNKDAMAIDVKDKFDHSINWDWDDKHVSQSYLDSTKAVNKDMVATDIVESATVLICAGPADLQKAATAATANNIRIVPIGLVETASISMNKQVSRIFEIGSKISYLIPGKVMGGINMSRVFFDGPSMLKALYYGEVTQDSNGAAVTDGKTVNFASDNKTGSITTSPIGSGNVGMNLQSSFFDHPMGLTFIFQDQQGDMVGEIYFEGCYITSYGMGISASANVLTESVSVQFQKVTPIITSITEGKGLTDIPIIGSTSTTDSGTPPTTP